MHCLWRFAAGAIVLTIVATVAPARADVDLQAAFTSGLSWRRAHPALNGELTTTAARDVPESRVPVGGALTGLGAGFDTAAIVDDRIAIPAFGLGAYGAVGSYD